MRLPHFLLLMLINVVWGANFLAARYTVLEVPPIFGTASRFILVAVLLLPFANFKDMALRPMLKVGLVLGAGHFGLMYTAMALAHNVSSMAVLTLTNVPFATILAVIFLKEQIKFWRILGLTLSFVGVVMINFNPAALDDLLAGGLVVASSMAYAWGTIFMRNLKGVSTFSLQAAIAVISVPVLLMVSLVFEEGQIDALMNASYLATGGIVYSAIGATIIGHGGIYFLLQRYPVTVISPYTLLSQVVAVFLSIVVLGDRMGGAVVAGAIVTFIGVTIITIRNRDTVTPKLERKTGPVSEL